MVVGEEKDFAARFSAVLQRPIQMTPPPTRARLALLSALAPCVLLASADSAAESLQISSDPFTDEFGQHMTEVEPHVFAYGPVLVATFQMGRMFGGGCSDIGFSTSVDRGLTWQDGSLPGLTIFSGGDRYPSVSDPAVAYDVRHGLWLIVSLAVGGRPAAIFISRSGDGLHWDNPITAATAEAFFDKPWIACDNSTSSRFFGNCYIEWDDVSAGLQVLMSTSTDGGATWSAPAATADEAAGLAGEPLVRDDGQVVVPYRGLGNLSAFVSDDGGQTWGNSVQIAELVDHIVEGDFRAIALPSAAIDGDGKIYVAWHDCRFRSSCQANDIVFSTSADGLAWSKPSRVPLAALSSSAEFFIPALGADRNTSAPNVSLGLVYYSYPDADCTPSTCELAAGFVRSANGGATWSAPIDVTPRMSLDWLAATSQGRMVGDYLGVAFTDDGIPHPIFAGAVQPSDQFLESMFTCTDCPANVAAQMQSECVGGANCPAERAQVEADRSGLTASNDSALKILAPATRVNIGTVLPLEVTGPASANGAIEWWVEEGPAGGTVSNAGVYRAPVRPGTFHAVARNGSDQARLTIEVFTVQ